MLNCRLNGQTVGLMVLGLMDLTVLLCWISLFVNQSISTVQNKKENRTSVVMNAATFPSCRDISFFPATLLEVLS